MKILDIDNAKSYATEENLLKALRKLDLAEMRPLVVRNREGPVHCRVRPSLVRHGSERRRDCGSATRLQDDRLNEEARMHHFDHIVAYYAYKLFTARVSDVDGALRSLLFSYQNKTRF
jgi:hypothetical protein